MATELRAHLTPISGSILQLEKETGVLSAVYEQFQILSDFYKSSELPNAAEVLELFEKRWIDYFSPAVAIARLLNPAYVGQQEDQRLLEKAEMSLRQTIDEADAPRLISSLWCYLGKSDGFTQEMFDIFAAGMSPVIWWSRGRFGSQHEALRSLASKCCAYLQHLQLQSGTGQHFVFIPGLETSFGLPGCRNWSMFSRIQSR